MAKSKKAIIEDAVESLGWSASFQTQRRRGTGKVEKYISVSGHSDAGEDLEFSEFYDSLDEIPEKFFEAYQDFDTEEHVRMWLEAKQNKVSNVPDAKTLVEDAEWIEQFLLKLAETLRDALAGRKQDVQPEPKDKLQALFDLIDLRDRSRHGVYDAWDTINGLVNEVYGIDIGDALNLWEKQKGA